MTQPTKINFKIYQGGTFREVLRWESATKVYVNLTGATKTAPLTLTAPTHGLPVGWRFQVTGVQGMKELNSLGYITSTETTLNEITVNSVNAAGFTTYTSGGILEYNQPVNLTGMTARMQLREKLDSDTVIHELTTENGGIVIDNILKTITLNVSATTTAGFNFNTAVYSLELVSGTVVTPFSNGTITLVREVTR